MPVEPDRTLPDNPDAAREPGRFESPRPTGERLSRPLRPGLVIRLERRIDELAAALLVRQGRSHPDLATPGAERMNEVLAAARGLLRTFFTSYLEAREPEPAELEAAIRDGTLRAGQAVNLGDLLAAYHEGAEALWHAAVQEAADDEQDELVDLARHLLHWQGLLARTAGESFMREVRHRDEGTRGARRMLAELLLSGREQPAAEPDERHADLWERAGVRSPAEAVVLAYHALESPGAPGAASQVVQERLEQLAGRPVLADITAEGGVVLLPGGETDDAPAVTAVLDALSEALGVPLAGGSARTADPSGIRAAAREARELLALAVALDLGAGVHRRDRLLLEHALSARRSSLEALAALLAPLERRPNLLTTLSTWFALDFDRGGTAGELAIHRNTLDYRLRRVSDLTGLALDSARGLQTAGAALLARRLLAADPQP